MNLQLNNPQAVVYDINNTNDNNYVNHALPATTPGATMAECPKEHAESQNEACATPWHTLDGQNNVTRLPVMAHLTSNNQMCLDQVKMRALWMMHNPRTRKLWQDDPSA